MDLMPARDPLVIEIVWLRSKSEGQGGMHHPWWDMERMRKEKKL